MNSYPTWWNTTLTIYNKYNDKQTGLVKWYRHVLHNCFWKYTGDKVTINNTVIETSDIICRIPKDDAFLEKYLWMNIPNDEMSNYFTIGEEDIIVRGEVTDEIDEYHSGTRSSDLITKYKKLQGCMQVKKCAINIEGGRCNEHYFVKGV